MPVVDLTRVTVRGPGRQLDIALPDHAPLAELLPELLRRAGEGLADQGERHGGWALRRADGTPLVLGQPLSGQGVPDGATLYLVPARTEWPELDYDDVVEAIAASARQRGRAWNPVATRAASLVVAGLGLAAALFVLPRSGAGGQAVPGAALLALAVAALLLAAGVIASRAYRDEVAGAGLAGYALPWAFGGGWLLLPGDGAGRLLVASGALLLVAVSGAVGVRYPPRLFVGGITAALAGVAGALVGLAVAPVGAAAIALAGLVTGMAAVPMLAVRLGRLPAPTSATATAPHRAADPDLVRAAVIRSDEVLTGALLGISAAAVACALVLARDGGTAPRLLVAVSAGTFLLRARLFPVVRHRVPLLAAGVVGLGLLVTGTAGALPSSGRTGLAVLLVAAALLVLVASARYRERTASPYLGRLADVLDAVCVVSVVPVAAAVLGLYTRMRGLAG